MLAQIIGLDHIVIAVRDLDRAADDWRRLGFTLSPRGTHSAHMGSGNYTIMFGDDYLELLGVLAPTPANTSLRDFLADREGIERAAFTARSAQAGAAELQARGIAASEPLDFGRPVDLPDGGRGQARFRTFNWPAPENRHELRLFACEHQTREVVWIPQLQIHANGAQRILRIEVIAADPAASAARMGHLIDQMPQAGSDGSWSVPSGEQRAQFVFMSRATLAARYPSIAIDALPDQGAAVLVLQVQDITKAAKAAGNAAPAVDETGKRVVIGPEQANGLGLVFET